MYRPAYVDIEVYNNTEVPSIAGSFNIYVTFEMDYYNQIDPKYPLNLAVESNYAVNSGPFQEARTKYWNHFIKGLNGNTVDYTQGDVATYDVFTPKIGVKVPALSKHESTTVRVYLEPFPKTSSFTRYPEGESVRTIDFENMYFYNGGKKFTNFTLSGQFPTPEEYLHEELNRLYLDPETKYVYTSNYTHSAYEKIQKPVNSSWSN